MADGYSETVWVAAHTAALAVMLDDGSGEPTLQLRTSGGVLLAEFVIDDVTSAVNGTTGDITIEIATQEDAALANGTAAYLDLCDGADVVHYRMSCQQGTSPVAGKVVMNTLVIVAGAPVDMLSYTIPAGAVFS